MSRLRIVSMSKEELERREKDGSAYMDIVVRGKWIAKSTHKTEIREDVIMPVYEFTCNQCGYTVGDSYLFCPWCGADMREEDAK